MALTALLLVGHSLLPGGKAAANAVVAPGLTASSASPENEIAAGETVRLSAGDALKALVIPAAHWRDPFALQVRTGGTAAAEGKPTRPDLVDTVHLSALWTQGGATFSLINDRICQAGDAIGRLKVESATQEGVWISHWQGRSFISLGGDFTLKTPADKMFAAPLSSL